MNRSLPSLPVGAYGLLDLRDLPRPLGAPMARGREHERLRQRERELELERGSRRHARRQRAGARHSALGVLVARRLGLLPERVPRARAPRRTGRRQRRLHLQLIVLLRHSRHPQTGGRRGRGR